MSIDVKNKKIAILGFGMEGVASAKYLHEKGGKIWVLDKRKKEELDQRFVSAIERLGVEFVLGPTYLSDLSRFDIIVRSPGVKRLTPELVQAEKDGVTITSQIKLFFDACPAKII